MIPGFPHQKENINILRKSVLFHYFSKIIKLNILIKAQKQEKTIERSAEKSQKKYSDSKKYHPLENKTKRYQERSPHDLSRTNVNLNEEKFSSTKKNYQEESKILNKPKNKYINYKYSNEKPKPEIQESSTPNKNYDLLQRNKIKSMYESQSTTNSSNSRQFLNKFKKVEFFFKKYLISIFFKEF